MHPALAVIVMTAYGTAESAVDARRHGADAYLVKPFAMPDLLAALLQLIDEIGLVQHRQPPGNAGNPRVFRRRPLYNG